VESMEAKRTPLIELLERVPRDAVLVVEHDQFSSSSHPVGRLCHEAAAALEAAREDAERWRHARRILTVEDIESSQDMFDAFGVEGDEHENRKADAAI